MNTMQLALTQTWAERLGFTLLHFMWQGALIAGLFAGLRSLLGRSTGANARYLLACLALGAMVAAPLATYGLLASLDRPSDVAGSSPSPAAAGLSSAPGASWYQPSAEAWRRILPWVVMAWMSGVLAFSVRLMGGWLGAARLASRQSRPAPAEWQRALERLKGRMGIGGRVRLLASSLVETPTVIGWLRPMILAPAAALTGLPSEQIEALLAHELAHIGRRDYLVNLLQSLAEAVLFYHPAVWWVSNQIRVERELCCDDLAVAASGDVLTYARALAELESSRPAHRSTAMAATGGRLATRIGRLLGQPHGVNHTRLLNPPACSAGASAAWALGMVLLLGISAVAIRAHPAAASEQEPAVSRDAIWTDTARQGDIPLLVRGLGILTTKTAVELKIAESQSAELRPGLTAFIALRNPSDVFAGRVAQVRPGVTGGTVTVDVQVEGPLPAAAQPGVAVDGTIQIGTIGNVIYVGRPVFCQANTAGTLFKLEPDGRQAVRVKVQYGRASVNLVEIRSGLQPGDKVILSDVTAFNGADRISLK